MVSSLVYRRLTVRVSEYDGAGAVNLVNIRSVSNSVMKYLNVAEKNNASENISNQLSRGTAQRGCSLFALFLCEGLSQYNKIYEFEAEVLGQRAQMVMMSVSVHLLALEFVGAYKYWQGCSPLALFDAPVFKYCSENFEKIKRTLEREIQGCQGLIIWTDCDREGENIGFETISVCTAVKRGVSVHRAPVYFLCEK